MNAIEILEKWQRDAKRSGGVFVRCFTLRPQEGFTLDGGFYLNLEIHCPNKIDNCVDQAFYGSTVEAVVQQGLDCIAKLKAELMQELQKD